MTDNSPQGRPPVVGGTWMIPLIIAYLVGFLILAAYSLCAMTLGWLPAPSAPLRLPLMCCAIAYVGGAMYCFRAIYLNKCVRKHWDPDWHVWYFIRPITSTIAGAVSFLFLKAGLLILESSSDENASEVSIKNIRIIYRRVVFLYVSYRDCSFFQAGGTTLGREVWQRRSRFFKSAMVT
jgi:hypothetical protein